MGYNRQKLQVTGGGFNCLPPVDKVPITDALLLQNFRSDAFGRYVSRAGYPSQFSIAGAGIAHSAASMGGPGSPYYVGTNSGITAPTSSLYYAGGLIATGFDGNRIGFAAQNGAMWVMNRGNQGRHDPVGGWLPYGLTAPPASPTAAPDASSPALTASVTYTFGLLGAGYTHFITIAGTTYSVLENGYTALDIVEILAGTIAPGAGTDPNCSVTWDGVSLDLVITATVPNTLIQVSGSDGNANADLGIGGVTSLPNGTYQFYLTFQSADLSLESNPGPASAAVTVVSQNIAVTIPAVDAPVDPRIGFVNIYATGGNLASPYRVGQVPYPGTPPITFPYVFLDTISDLQATNNGNIMPLVNGLPPACRGIIGPYYGQLYAWSTAANKNRLYFTQPGLPQYWNTDAAVGDWVDVGLSDEEIVWCSIHGNVMVIYKERTIWMLIGTSSATATLEQVYDGMGLSNAFALAPAGAIDYFVGPNGLRLFDLTAVHELSGDILPLFNQQITNAGAQTPPGSVLPGTAFNSTSTSCYAIALGHALGRLYIAYAELGTSDWNLLVYDEGKLPEQQALLRVENAPSGAGRWFYHRNAIAGITGGFFGFFFDGINMCGLTGEDGGAAQGFSLADFRGFLTEDAGPVAIECVYQSHYEDCGFPENDKQWLEIAIDYSYVAGTAANIYAGFNAGVIAPQLLGTLATGTRRTVSFPLTAVIGSTDEGFLARNMSMLLDALTTGQLTIHNVYFYYYVEARVAIVASTIPIDLGVGKVKECKELELDISATGATSAAITTDLPGNALTIRKTIAVGVAGRAVLKYPFTTLQGLLWQLTLAGGPFRLYSARLLMRVIGIFVEAYESAAGFVWDSMETPVGAGDVSTIDQLRFDMESLGTASVTLLTDLPGEVPVNQGTFALATGAMARAWVTVPVQDGVEARSVRLQTTGAATYRIYRAQVRHGHIGRYLAGATPSGANDQFRTLEFDMQSEKIYMFKRIEIDLRVDTTGSGEVTMNVFTSQDISPLAILYTTTLSTPSGREALLAILTPGIRGRLLRVQLTGPVAARIYKIRVWARPVQDDKAGWAWLDFPLEDSPVLPVWLDILQPPDDTSNQWQWVDVPFDVQDGAPSQ